MPNCFTLTKIGDSEPMPLAKVDELVCAHLGAPVHPTKYCCWWFDAVGFLLAMGRSFDDIIASVDFADWSEELQKITHYLKANFTANAWAQRH